MFCQTVFAEKKSEAQRGQALGYSLAARKWRSWDWNSGPPAAVFFFVSYLPHHLRQRFEVQKEGTE